MRTLKSGVKVSEKEPPKKKYKEDDPPRSSPANDQTKKLASKSMNLTTVRLLVSRGPPNQQRTLTSQVMNMSIVRTIASYGFLNHLCLLLSVDQILENVKAKKVIES